MEESAGRPPAKRDTGVSTLTRPERGQQFPARGVVEGCQVHSAVALVAQHLDERRPTLLGRGLKLAFNDAKQVHLQRFDLEILCVTAVRTRK